MATKAQIDAQIKKLQAARDEADDDDEVWVRPDGGKSVIRLTGSRARSLLSAAGLLGEDGDDDDDDDDDEQDEADAKPPPKARKKAAKDPDPPRREFGGRFFGRD